MTRLPSTVFRLPAPVSFSACSAARSAFDTTVVVVGIIGAGIFINPYIVARRLDSEALVLAAYIVGGGIALAGAFSFAVLASLFPRAGGEHIYLREAYHPLVGLR